MIITCACTEGSTGTGAKPASVSLAGKIKEAVAAVYSIIARSWSKVAVKAGKSQHQPACQQHAANFTNTAFCIYSHPDAGPEHSQRLDGEILDLQFLNTSVISK